MWATLTLMSALSLAPAADAGELQLSNARATYGRSGPTRPAGKYLPGDIYFLSFDIEGLQITKKGYANWSMKLEVLDAAGKPLGGKEALDVPHTLWCIQGGGRLPQFVYSDLSDAKPGEYTVKVTITDQFEPEPKKPDPKRKKPTATLTKKYEVGEKGFGIVRLICSSPGLRGPGPDVPGVGTVGDGLFLNYTITGFGRDPKTKQPSLRLEISMLDEAGKPTLENPFAETLPSKDDDPLPADVTALPLFNSLALTKPGKYTLELKATDQVTKKTVTASYPIVVVDLPK